MIWLALIAALLLVAAGALLFAAWRSRRGLGNMLEALEGDARFRAIFERAGIGIAIVSTENEFITTNPALQQMLGYSAGELRRLPFARPDVPSEWEPFRSLMIGELDSYQGVAEYRRKDGEPISARLNVTLVRDARRLPRYAVITIEDITRQTLAETQLLEAEARYRTLVEQVPAVTYAGDIDEQNSSLYVSPQIRQMLGYTPEEYGAYADKWLDVIHPEDQAWVRAENARAGTTGQPFQAEYRVLARDGRIVWVRNHAQLVCDADGRPICWQGIMLDITAQKQAEEELRRQREFAAQVIDASVDGIFAFDSAYRYTVWNPAMERITGVGRGEALGRRAIDVFPSFEESGEVRYYQQALAGHAVVSRGQVFVLPDTGAIGFFDSHFSPIRDGTGRIIGGLAVVHDVTEHRAREAHLTYRAFHDSLTGLPNRALFLESVGQALARAARARAQLAVLFVDFDRFKSINDAFGHTIGDAVLIAAAERLRSSLRGADIVSRFGGDEFTVLIEDLTDRASAAQTATRILQAFRRPLVAADREVALTPSIGIAISDDYDANPEDIVRRADMAMYRAKHLGRGAYAVADVDAGGG